MLLLNKEPIKYGVEELNFYATRYQHDNTLAIVANTTKGEPYAMVTINLSDYDYCPSDEMVFLDHNLSEGFKALVIEIFAATEVPISYGLVQSSAIHLKQEYVDLIKEREDELICQ